MPQRVAAVVTAILGAAGLVLAVAGLYGVIAYSASHRTREIGIRIALGARRVDVLTMILSEGMRLAVAGVVLGLGLGLAVAGSRLISSLLFGVSPVDATTYAAAVCLVAATTLLATWLPARRAASANPMSALRDE